MQERGEFSRKPLGNEITVIGDPSLIGDKARALLDWTPRIREVGLHTPPRWFLAQDLLIHRSGEPDGESHHELFEGILADLDDGPVMVRSSAAGDARGTGIYKSEVASPTVEGLERAMHQVIASYFTPQAEEFRRKLGLPEEFGVIIEPMIGSWNERDGLRFFSPFMSGFGYTETPASPGIPSLGIVLGFGSDTTGLRPHRITAENLQYCDYQLGRYIDDMTYSMGMGNVPNRYTSLTLSDLRDGGGEDAVVWDEEEGLRKASLGMTPAGPNLEGFFTALRSLSQHSDSPLYFEWALAERDGIEEIHIVQIADIAQKNLIVEFDQKGENVLEADEILSTGKKSANKVVFVSDRASLPKLEEFNRENRDFILIVDGNVITSYTNFGFTDVGVQFNFTHFSNAASVVVRGGGDLGHPLEEHFRGLGDTTDILIGLYSGYNHPRKEGTPYSRLRQRASDYGDTGLELLEGEFTVVADAGQNRLVVYEEKDKAQAPTGFTNLVEALDELDDLQSGSDQGKPPPRRETEDVGGSDYL